jgi:hypothetical protein
MVYYEVAAMAVRLNLGMQQLDKTEMVMNRQGTQVLRLRGRRSEGLEKFNNSDDVDSLLLRVSVSLRFPASSPAN